ncbi:hypothetical protein IWZ00DRAFT_182994 [Phyllosticta capitalensis]
MLSVAPPFPRLSPDFRSARPHLSCNNPTPERQNTCRWDGSVGGWVDDYMYVHVGACCACCACLLACVHSLPPLFSTALSAPSIHLPIYPSTHLPIYPLVFLAPARVSRYLCTCLPPLSEYWPLATAPCAHASPLLAPVPRILARFGSIRFDLTRFARGLALY